MRRAAALLALLPLLPVAACGGDDEPATTETTEMTETTETTEAAGDAAAPEDYAEEVCTSIGSWYDQIDGASTALVDEAAEVASDPAAGKELVLGFLDDAIDFTEQLVADLEDAGVPDTDAGEETADELVAGIEEVQELFEGARDDTDALPADDPQALGTGLQDIGAALQESATAVGANFEEVLASVDDPELGAAFEDAESCQDLATIS